jgi:predicted aspartyl protease
MLDTGASVTILSRASFEQIDSGGFRYRGSRLFNTANGVTQGDVYRISSITLGNSRLGGVEIAVLDYESATGVDGLLGMNVLRNYRFEIDQDQDVLYLHARQ